MNANNLVLLRGQIATEPIERELASGAVVVQFDLAVTDDTGRATVPVAWFDPPPARALAPEQAVVVVGGVRRRFFRAGGATQSRTEVVAERVVDAGRRRDVTRVVEAAAGLLRAGPS